MRKLYFILLFTFIIKLVSGQDFDLKEYISSLKVDTIQLDSFFINGVNFYSNKQELIKGLGKPDSIVNPKYECGGFSEDWQGEVFLQYFYGSLNFIGSNDEYQIERIDFTKCKSIKIEYKGRLINYKTEISVFKELFPKSFKNRNVKNGDSSFESMTLLPSILSDDKVFLSFKNGILIGLEYWSPC
ncbi:hypothetical protein [Maribellus sediminis]|uniref:hypothetical protein n=1 Tax=Maribellus sediminis TaxID=2696285 RepID=UPI001430C2B0|nr:hypothetical protein [Maribellus sediminis]